MKNCTVSIVDGSGQAHTLEVEASSVFDAAAQATERWTMMSWYEPDAVLEVRAGEEVWRVRGRTGARAWEATRTEPQVKQVLDYLEKEANLMGLLAASSVAGAGLIAKDFLTKESKLLVIPGAAVYTGVGCLLLVLAAVFFGVQRNKTMGRYGAICLRQLGLAANELKKLDVEKEADAERDLDWLLVNSMVFSGRFWNWYQRGLPLLALGLANIILGFATVVVPHPALRTAAWPITITISVPFVVYFIYRRFFF